MTDPEGGNKPQPEGASAQSRRDGKTTRRGRSKRKGSRPASVTSGSVEAGAALPPGHAERSDMTGGQPSRKRKRRRRGGGHAAEPQTRPVQARENHSANAAGAVSEPGKAGKSGKRRRRNRNRRHHTPQQVAAVATVVEAIRPVAPPMQARDVARESGHHAPRVPASHSGPVDLYAALDLGTNNCRLLIAQPTRPGSFRVVDAFSRIVRLGEGLAASGRLSEEAMDRAVEALKVCSVKLAGRDIRRMRLIATEACRAAANGEDFLSRVTTETGLKLEIINRETEARLAVSGCSSLVGREARSVVLFDIGGGSSEIAVIRIGENRSSRLANHITHWTSLPVGVVTLSERHGGRDVTPDVFEAMINEVEIMLGRFECPPLQEGHDFHLIGTSGTVTTLAGVHLDLPRYDRRRVDGLWLSDAEVSAMQAKLLSWGYSERAANPCIGPDRADLVLAGCAILEAIRRRWPAGRMRVADRGLREGLLTDMMADDGVWRRGRGRRPPREREHA
ncbi:Ppx/GppA family phosphatase [Ciceribacter sp. L1K23]|uniref:Ppx/GppA phosphatase family protein n=1 Tax=Ciceribacter sp. L1K23 TaxID=2820276 RepID=UPI001B819961|nr:Ppx/GppA family phosphatase [Ciceribacter sp. L1K23]